METQKKLPLLITTVLAGMLVLTPVLSSLSDVTPAEKAGHVHVVEATAPGGEKIYGNVLRAANLLEAGEDTDAARLMEGISRENLVIRDGDLGGSAALNSFSSTTVLMRLGRLTAQRAHRAFQDGDRTAALAWIGRCQSLARQALATSEPTIAALKVARYLDTQAGKVEKEVHNRWDTPQQAARVTQREDQLKQVWKEEILGRLMEVRHQCANGELQSGQEPALASDLITYYQMQRNEAFAAVAVPDSAKEAAAALSPSRI